MTDPQAPQAILPLHIDSTMISCFRSCPEKFKNEFILGLRPSSMSVDLHAGGCFASALENIGNAVHAGESFEKAKLRAFARYMDDWGDFTPIKDTPKSRERVWEAVEAYFEKWPLATDHIQPFILNGKPSYEFTFGIPLLPATDFLSNGSIPYTEPRSFPLHPSGNPFIYSGRFDLLGQMGSTLVVRDEKTTTSIASNWSESWNLRSQFLGYCWACQQSGLNVSTVCIRGVGILKTKFHLLEAIKQFPQHRIERWHEQLRRDLWRLRRSWDEGYFDVNFAESCTSYGGCAFRTLCESDHPERWLKDYRVARWNPLQKNPIAGAPTP